MSLEFSRRARVRGLGPARVKTASAIEQCAPGLLSTALEEHKMMEHNTILYPTKRELAGMPLGSG